MSTLATRRRSPLPSELKPEQVVALRDSREQLPLDLSPLRVEMASLPTGDYSVKGLEHGVAVERKGLSDLLGCVGMERDRFDREIQRLVAYSVRALVVEATWADLERADWRSRITASQALGSVLGWVAAGVPVVMAGDHQRAGRYVSRLLFIAARRRWREARALVGNVMDPEGMDPETSVVAADGPSGVRLDCAAGGPKDSHHLDGAASMNRRNKPSRVALSVGVDRPHGSPDGQTATDSIPIIPMLRWATPNPGSGEIAKHCTPRTYKYTPNGKGPATRGLESTQRGR